MAIYREGKAALAADGTVTGTGTKWQSSLSLIRPGATIMFLSSPIQIAVVNKVVSDTEIKAITTKGAVVESTDYAILLSDSLTVDGLAQDVAETLRYYQSQETVIADAVEFFKNFDFESLQNLANQIKADSEAAGASATAAAASEVAAKTSETNSKASEVAAEAAREQVQHIINDAGEQSTLVALAQPEGFNKIGKVASFSALRALIPTAAGQSVLLRAYNDGWAALNKPPVGGGEFVAFSGAGTDNGGTVAAVNSSFHWRRVVNGYLTPEMFGAAGDGQHDDSDAIISANAVSVSSGIDMVRGDGIYLVKKPIPMISGSKPSPAGSGFSARQGFRLALNVVIVDAASWPNVPTKFWTAQAVFLPKAGTAIEHYRLHINEMDCAGKAIAVATTGGAINTSHIHIGNLRNHIIGYKNYLDMNSQSTMNTITGYIWQGGYHAVLIGGRGNGGGNSECHDIDIKWCATQKFGAISLQDRSQYTAVNVGTFDYNGKYLSMLTLTNITDTGNYAIEYGDTITDGTNSGFAMSSLMNRNGNYIVFVAGSSDMTDGTSPFTVGDTITCSETGMTATISAVTLCSSASVRYFDIIVSNRTGDFSKCKFFCEYTGGLYGHNEFTNFIWLANSVSIASAINIRGLGLAGDSSSSIWYMQHLYGTSPFLTLNSNGLNFGKPIILDNQPVTGRKITLAMKSGVEASVMTFVAAASETNNRVYIITVSANDTSIGGFAIVRVGVSGITILASTIGYLTLKSSGLTLRATMSGPESANVTFNAQRQY